MPVEDSRRLTLGLKTTLALNALEQQLLPLPRRSLQVMRKLERPVRRRVAGALTRVKISLRPVSFERGDRVAVLGRGITVVEQVCDKEIIAPLWNREALSISLKAVVWDQQNVRWEASCCLDTRDNLALDK